MVAHQNINEAEIGAYFCHAGEVSAKSFVEVTGEEDLFVLGRALLQELLKIFTELFPRVSVGDASLTHHTRLMSGCSAGFLLGSGRNRFIAYLVSGDGRDDFSSCANELGIAPSAHRVRAG